MVESLYSIVVSLKEGVKMASFLTSAAFLMIIAAIMMALGSYQVVNSVVYIHGILHKGTNNGFMPLAMWTSLVIGLSLLIVGIAAIVLAFKGF